MAKKQTETTTTRTKGAETPKAQTTAGPKKPTAAKKTAQPTAAEVSATTEPAAEPKPTAKPRSWTRPAEETLAAAAAPDALAPAPAQRLEALDATGPAKKTKTRGAAEPAPKKTRPPKEDLVVFAFRLTEAERDLIHKTAGPRNATQFVRRVAVAFAREDGHAFRDVVEEARKLRG